MTRKLRDFKVPKTVRKIVLVFLCILVFNALVAGLGTPFLCERIWFFSGKSGALVLSDLLFLEGAIIFAVGSFIAGGASILRIETPTSLFASPGGHTEYVVESRKKQIRFGLAVMVLGGTLMVSSVVIGSFLI
ncbi:MAG: hypothetical protein U9O89_02750 [Thermoproteota archaeon]|nr:hypothetical protein [Thermoproteota archaeon]